MKFYYKLSNKIFDSIYIFKSVLYWDHMTSFLKNRNLMLNIIGF